jgi:hypothetical protein
MRSRTNLQRIEAVALATSAVVALACWTSFWGAPLSAQTTGPGTDQGKVSKPGEVQSAPREKAKETGPTMKPDGPLPPPPAGKTEKMEDQLKTPPRVSPGETQTKVDAKKAENPARGGGAQRRGAATEAPAPGSHLHLVLRLKQDGDPEVVSAVEVPGELVTSDVPAGDFVYEVTSNGQPLAVQAVPDPFEMRSFPGPQGSPIQGHHFDRAKTANVVVKVPQTDLARINRGKFAVSFYKIKPGQAIERLTPDGFQRMKRDQRLEAHSAITTERLTPAIQQQGRKLIAQ